MDTPEQIRNRILRSAARQWGYQESEMDLEAFDPLVRLLVEACSGEIARLERMLEQSENRILERMLEQLSPEVLTGPLPAHAMATFRALAGTETATRELQCFGRLEHKKEKNEVYFAPLTDTTVVNGAIALMEVGGKELFLINEKQKERVASGKGVPGVRGSTLWLGLELDRKVISLDGLRFYFNWLNAPRLDENLEWLRRARWSCGGHELNVMRGMPLRPPGEKQEVASFLQKEYSRYLRNAEQVLSYYSPHLITISGFKTANDIEWPSLLERYPHEFETHYPPEELAGLDRKLLWIEIAFPTPLSTAELQSTICALNPVPVANLRLHRTEGRLRDQVNIIPLDTENYYFDILSARNRQGNAYDEVPLTNLRDYRAGQYSVRRRGTGKLGEREAGRALLNLLDLLRDESAAFSAYGRDALISKITSLNQQLKDLEQQVGERGTEADGLAFLLVRPVETDRYLDVEYLSTRGSNGNGLIAGQSLELLRFSGIDRKSARLLTTATGGRDPLSARDRKYAYKKAIITRGRIVSREDIRAFCQAAFGPALVGEVNIRKGIARGPGPGQGLERIMQVTFELDENGVDASGETLDARINELERSLNFHSAGILPIRVYRKVPATSPIPSP